MTTDKRYSPAVCLTARLRNNNLSYYAGRLALAKALKDEYFAKDAFADLRKELAAIEAAVAAYEAAADPDAEPDEEPST